jgi:hypothetical protein
VEEAPALPAVDLPMLAEQLGQPLADAYPLSPFQRHMLRQYLERDEPGLYLINLDFVVRGRRFEPELFRRAWQQVIDRHPVLRTSFAWQGLDEPLQLVWERAEVTLDTDDWRGLDAAAQSRRLAELFARRCTGGLPLARAPHTRLALIPTGAEETLFVWTINLMLQDGWSFPILLTELFVCYEALEEGREPELPERLPYRRYIELAERRDRQAAEAFWRRTLSGFTAATPLLELCAGEAGAAPGEVAKQARELSLATKGALQQITARHQLTLYTLAAGAWALVLAQHTGRSDVVFGIWVSTRPAELAGADAMVGNFLNFLPLRLAVEPERPLLEWLGEVQERLLELRRFELAPPDEVRAVCELPPGAPLYESYLVFESFPIDASLRRRAERWQMEFVYSDVGRTGVPLRVEVHPTEGLTLLMQHYRHRIGGAAVAELMDDFATLLEAMAADPQRPLVALLELLAPAAEEVR